MTLFASAFVLLLALLSTPALAQATAEDRAFIERINRQLDAYGRETGIIIRYADVAIAEDNIIGRYYTFAAPTVITAMDGVRYALTVRAVSLKREEGDVWQVSIPRVVHLAALRGETAEPEQKMLLQLYGAPSLKLMIDASQQATYYDIDAPNTIEVRAAQELEGGKRGPSIGTSRFYGQPIDTFGWQAISPIPKEDIAYFLKTVMTPTEE